MHEASYCKDSCFVTLTYDKKHLPAGYNLCKRDLQLFLKDLRRQLEYHGLGRIRAYFACGEYGTEKGRPHYHVLLLGWKPTDMVFHHISYSGLPVYTSVFLQKIWKRGYCPVGSATHKSAGYVARYQKKDHNNDGDRLPSFVCSSRNIPLSNGQEGAIGAQWVLDHHAQLRHGYIPHPDNKEIKLRIPEYYFDLLQRWFPVEYEQLKQLRYDFAMSDNFGVLICDDHGEVSCQALPGADIQGLASFLKLPDSHDMEVLAEYRRQLVHAEMVQKENLSKLKRRLYKKKKM